MKAANNITFKIRETGNGYGHIFAEFGEGDEKSVEEIGMVSLCNNEGIAATIISMIESYIPSIGIEEQIEFLMAESEMRNAEDRFNTLKKKTQRKESNEL